MLTLQKDKTTTEIVELHRRSTRSKKAVATVYYSHNTKTGANVAPAAGVLALHKDSLKKIWKLSSADFDRVCVMLDTGAEPDVGEPLRTEYWELKKVFERSLRTEMYPGTRRRCTLSTTCPGTRTRGVGLFWFVEIVGPGRPGGWSTSF